MSLELLGGNSMALLMILMDLYQLLGLIYLYMSYVACEDTVADDIGPHMLRRISALLTPQECQDFIFRLQMPEEDIVKLVDSLSEEEPKLRRKRREIVSRDHCKEELDKWYKANGNTIYWDRISDALMKVDRIDVAKELGKNLNQDNLLEMMKYVHSYSKGMQNLKSPLLTSGEEYNENTRTGRQVDSFNDEDWELIIERQQLPPYNTSLSAWCWYMVLGVVIGFFGAALFAGLTSLLIFWIIRIDQGVNEFPVALRLKEYSVGNHDRDRRIFPSMKKDHKIAGKVINEPADEEIVL